MGWKDWLQEPSYIIFAPNARDFATILDAISRETDARARLKEAQAKLEAAHHFKHVREVHVHHHYGGPGRTESPRLRAPTRKPQVRPWIRRLLTDQT